MKKLLVTAMATTILMSCSDNSKKSSSTKSTVSTQSEHTARTDIDLNSVHYHPSFSMDKSFGRLVNEGKSLSTTDSRYFNITSFKNSESVNLNYETYSDGLKTIVISGKHIVINRNDLNGLYKVLRKTTDVEKVIINVETLELSVALELHQANVEIYAKKLILSDYAQIITTPIEQTNRAQQFTDGVDGLNGGDVKIIVETVEKNKLKADYTIITNGGQGQKAGEGQIGTRGANPQIVEGTTFHLFSMEPFGGRRVGVPAGDGQNAQVGGKPGEGGDAGFVITNTDLRVSTLGGRAGEMDTYKEGGEPGKPARTCEMYIHRGVRNCHIAIKGDGVDPKQAIREFGSSSVVEYVDESWVNSGYIWSELRFAKDLYQAYKINKATKHFVSLEKEIRKSNDKSISVINALNEISTFKNQITARQDYFGNSITWTPNLSLLTTYELFKQEVDRSIKLILMTEKLKLSIGKETVSFDEISQLQEELYVEVEGKREEITNAVDKIVLNNTVIEDVKVSEQEFNDELKIVEKKIEQMAKKNLAPPKSDKMIKTVAAIAKVVPVGQPTLGAAAIGIEYIHELSKGNKSASEIVSDIPSLASQFEGFDWEKATTQVNDAFDELSPRHFQDMTTDKERLEHAKKMLDFSKPIYGAISDSMKLWEKYEVPRSELEAEISKIKNTHPVYKNLVKKLNQLLIKRELLLKTVSSFNHKVESALGKISTNYTAIATLSGNLLSLQTHRKNDFEITLNKIQEGAQRALEYYQYLFSKSYEYKFLDTYSGEMKLDKVTERARQLVKNDMGTFEENVDIVRAVFEGTLQSITKEIVSKFSVLGAGMINHKDYVLTEEELYALNKNEEIYLDFTSEDFFGSNKENIRINDIEVSEDFSIENFDNDDLEIVFSHYGKSILHKDEGVFLFEVNKDSRNSNYDWVSTVSPLTGTVYNSEPNPEDLSLIKTLTSQRDINTAGQVFIRPGGRSFIKVKLNRKNNENLKKLIIKIEYTSNFKN